MFCKIIPEEEMEQALRKINERLSAKFHVCWAQNGEEGIYLRDFENHRALTPTESRDYLSYFLSLKYNASLAQAIYYSPSHIYIAVWNDDAKE